MLEIVTETCPHCTREVSIAWDVKNDGYHSNCPFCGKRLMLCSECPATHGEMHCDYNDADDTCCMQKGVEQMTQEQEEKRDFVRRSLIPVLKDIADVVSWARYEVYNGDEYVTVMYKNGYNKRINVSADSLKALTVDVLERV